MDEYVKHAYETAIQEIPILPGENETEISRRRIGYLNIRFFMLAAGGFIGGKLRDGPEDRAVLIPPGKPGDQIPQGPDPQLL